jgi:hypothetical protein
VTPKVEKFNFYKDLEGVLELSLNNCLCLSLI